MTNLITRSTLNDPETTVEEIYLYLTTILENGEEPTKLEIMATEYLMLKNPRIAEKFNKILSPFSPEFSEAMDKYKTMVEQNHGEESEEVLDQFMLAMRLAPKWFIDENFEKAQEMGIFPKFTHCNEKGEPVLTSTEMAEFYGVPEKEILEKVDKLTQQWRDEAVPSIPECDPEKIHRFH